MNEARQTLEIKEALAKTLADMKPLIAAKYAMDDESAQIAISLAAIHVGVELAAEGGGIPPSESAALAFQVMQDTTTALQRMGETGL